MPSGQPITSISTNPIVAVVVAAILFAIGVAIVRRVAEAERDPWVHKALMACLILHLVAAPLQIFVVNHLYAGVADYNRYDFQGAALAPGFRHLDFSLAPANLRGIVADGSVSIVAGVVFAVVGVNQAAGFMVFSFMSFVGIMFFYRAFTLTFGGFGSHRYGYLIFFLPSLVFWTSDVSKEAIMIFLLGVIAYGCARILAHRGTGNWLLILACSAGAAFIRPNQLVLALGGFAVAMMFRPSGHGRFEPGRRFTSLVAAAAMVGIGMFVTLHFLPGLHGSLPLQQIAKNNSGTGAGFGSSGVPYSSNLLYYPRDVFVVLFDPLLFNAHGGGQLFEAVENTVVLVVVVASLRNLRILPRASLARPYLLMCTIFTALFCYFFASLGNLGLITRETTVVLPFFLVILCIPRGPHRAPPRYEWELTRRQRAARRRARSAAPPRSAGRGQPPRVASG